MAAFRNIYTALMLVIAGSSQKQLARQVAYLKCENQLLRSRIPDRIILTRREKNRLCRFAKLLSTALHELTTIADPGTIRRVNFSGSSTNFAF